jgi:uncharacterized protein involved in response to NO
VRSVTQLISVILALSAFAIALVAGMAVGNPADHVVGRAVMAMLVAQIVGALIGRAAQCVVDEHLEQYRTAHPAADAESAEQNLSTEHPEPSTQEAPVESDERLVAA